MKIALFCSSRNILPSLKTGGTEQPIYYLAKGLAGRGHNITVFAAKGSKIPGVKIREISPFVICVKQKYLNIQERISSFYDLSALADFFYSEADNFDLIQYNSYMFYEIIPFIKFSKTPVIIRINYSHNLMYSYIKDNLKKNENIYYLPISNFIKTVMPDLTYLNVIYPAVDMDQFKFVEKPKDYLFFIGRICYNKGVHIAIDVAKKTKKRLIIAGRIDQEGGESYFNEYIRPNLNKNIEYIGEIDFKTKIKLYKNAAVTLFPNISEEAFGNVQIESMACGTPVIAFDNSAAREIIKNKTNGYIIKEGDANEMVRAVGKIDKISRRKVRKWAEDNFSLEKYLDKHEEMYNKIKKNHV